MERGNSMKQVYRTVKIPQGLWCITPITKHKCKFFNLSGYESFDTCYAYCGYYDTLWLNRQTNPIKLIRCFDQYEGGK